jgi:hypothetical protein
MPRRVTVGHCEFSYHYASTLIGLNSRRCFCSTCTFPSRAASCILAKAISSQMQLVKQPITASFSFHSRVGLPHYFRAQAKYSCLTWQALGLRFTFYVPVRRASQRGYRLTTSPPSRKPSMLRQAPSTTNLMSPSTIFSHCRQPLTHSISWSCPGVAHSVV